MHRTVDGCEAVASRLSAVRTIGLCTPQSFGVPGHACGKQICCSACRMAKKYNKGREIEDCTAHSFAVLTHGASETSGVEIVTETANNHKQNK